MSCSEGLTAPISALEVMFTLSLALSVGIGASGAEPTRLTTDGTLKLAQPIHGVTLSRAG